MRMANNGIINSVKVKGNGVKYFAVCPNCGKKLCRASAGSSVDMVCPSCKKPIQVIVEQDAVFVKGDNNTTNK